MALLVSKQKREKKEREERRGRERERERERELEPPCLDSVGACGVVFVIFRIKKNNHQLGCTSNPHWNSTFESRSVCGAAGSIAGIR